MTIDKLDFRNPTEETFKRDGELPISAVIACAPNCEETVISAIEQLLAALELCLGADEIELVETDSIKLTNSARIIDLDDMTLFFSLSYPTVPGRTFEMQFGAPPSATLH
jgi:hypothetical protein